ncbi:hypothetical protein F4703DRAFT_1457435 [Phycomyces blakesleeanus]
MGCCGSKEDHDQDDLSEPILRNPHTRRNRYVKLLYFNDTHLFSQPTCPSYDTFDVKMEQDFWKDVIERTTRHFKCPSGSTSGTGYSRKS